MADDAIRRDEITAVRGSIPDVGWRTFSWSAIWAGVMAALGMEILFLLFGLFVNFAIINPNAADPASGVSIWSAVWYLVTAGWSLFFGGWVASRVAGAATRGSGAMHGVVTWGLVSLAGFLFAMMALGSLFTGMMGIARTAVSMTGEAGRAMNQAQQNAPQIVDTVLGSGSRLMMLLWLGSIISLVTGILGGIAGRRPYRAAGEEIRPRERLAA